MSKKRLVLFVEGDGDVKAVSVLVKRLLTAYQAWDAVELDPNPFKVGEAPSIVATKKGNNIPNWERLIKAACKKQNLGGILLVVDGDCDKVLGKPFCAKTIAKELAARATKVGAGSLFSVAVVLATQEFETWLIAGISSLAGVELDNGRSGVREGVKAPDLDIESAPRNAKGWLSDRMEMGYKPTLDQAPLTKRVDLDVIRARKLRSFKRLEDALNSIITAFRSDKHVSTP